MVRRAPDAPVDPAWFAGAGVVSVTRTPDELSIVAPDAWPTAPGDQVEADFAAFLVDGVLDFSLTGVLAGLTAPLADAEISVFAVSTFDTDMLLVRAVDADRAVAAWAAAGWRVDASA